MKKAPVAPPATVVIFGVTGDLTRRLLLPAIVNLQQSELLDPATKIIGVGRDDIDADILCKERLPGFFEEDGAAWKALKPRIAYQRGDFGDEALYQALGEQLDASAMFYLAVAPSFFGPIVEQLGKAGLLDESKGFRRVVVEKPFGTDLASAKALNARLLAQAGEEQLYRIDHFLGKETVQNIIVSRFANARNEAVWNNRYIDHVQITAAETVTVGSRGAFYDATGALRDMVPNHLFQLLALVAMEPPINLEAESLRNEKVKVIDAIQPIAPEDAVRGAYTAGKIGKEKVPAFRETEDVSPDSSTETYVALKLAVETWRWHGVPFYLRTGKGLTARDTEIVIRFRDAPIALFRDTPTDSLPPNQLILQIQPDEGIRMDMAVKRPGPLIEAVPASMSFAYADIFDMGHRTGYETLIYDVLIGDPSLFQRADQIEAGWRVVQPLLDAWTSGEPEAYEPGSAGPAGADELIARDGRNWHEIG
ncbi:glucose-6-phosphate dehydrogenase [Novosphingobium rosa]|uniref:glucose-6-phosphate dehydrogenase n=1 Tax=Novosphingobium rosa TaxID=76978 RepID=UPI00082C9C25|nr:glucose-6-phosphate dehydrogenase [Novosphingobium rosa]